jgi:hypothetical protein
VKDPDGMGAHDRLEYRAQERERLRGRASTPATGREVRFQRFTIDPLEDDPRNASGESIERRHAGVEDAHHGGVIDARDRLCLVEERGDAIGPRVGVHLEDRPHHLDGDRPVEAEVMPRVDDAEAPRGGDTFDAVLPVEQCPYETERVGGEGLRLHGATLSIARPEIQRAGGQRRAKG